MNSKKLRMLQAGTSMALALCLLALVYMALVLPATNPMWSKNLIEREIQQKTTLPELQASLRDAANNFTFALHAKNQAFVAIFIGSIAMTGFLGWILFMVGRLKNEEVLPPKPGAS